MTQQLDEKNIHTTHALEEGLPPAMERLPNDPTRVFGRQSACHEAPTYKRGLTTHHLFVVTSEFNHPTDETNPSTNLEALTLDACGSEAANDRYHLRYDTCPGPEIDTGSGIKSEIVIDIESETNGHRMQDRERDEERDRDHDRDRERHWSIYYMKEFIL
ncbi:hypothetical protein EVAR_5557_1 [Eumeta japonica]|uniref:Uncharacterized protein n=1 Tax=Eumeta variegata TaxID=151549 RepID=A0A4C1U1R3_EUMVA|nr:hypothetical protein EVAR_5557_1 [Eumeta japonica]